MKTNKILLGGLAGGVAFFFLGWLIWGILLYDYTSANMNQCASRPMGEMVWWAMIVSNLAFGLLLAVIFAWSNISGFFAGLKAGAVIGLLMSISIDLSFWSMTTMFSGMTALVADIIAYTVVTALIGAIVGWVMGTGKKSS